MKSVPFFMYAIVLAVAGNSSVGTSGSLQWSRLTREISCREHEEYPHNGVCCLNCPAGHYAKKHCERAGERGQCEPCEFGTYTEHPNGLERCLTCDKCREDQEMTSVCTSTKTTVCQCKAGRYCANEHACEVCKKCRKCAADEEVVKNCTSTSNSECRKKPPPDNPSTDSASWIKSVVIACVPILLLVIVLAIGFYCRKKRMRKKPSEIDSSPCVEVKIAVDEEDERTVEEIQNKENAELDEPEMQPFLPGITLVGDKHYTGDDEDKGIGESLPTTTNSSQISLPTHISPQHSPRAQRQPVIREDGQCRRLVPLNGENSLMQAFDIIGENLACQYRNRFFRLIGLSDNTIHDPALNSSGDAVYKLLKSWMEKEGLKADINDLIQALLDLQQKFSAETVIHEVIDKGYFRFEDYSS
ncbi:hypothetical protein GJAV_G00032730 [Gymnothorax javanicus]|nr:hypothetical protein GJAV_G00032730 [Gymnothorax javanicus]